MRKPESGPAGLTWTQPAPARQRSLGLEEIVTAAIALADEAGADALTMKAVSARLGSYTPMALYRYVYSKEGLVDLMLDRVVAEIPVPGRPGPDWRADLRTLAVQTRQMIKRHDWYAVLFHTRPPAGLHTMDRLEFMLAVLTERGAGPAAAMSYAALIDRHILGSGLREAEEAMMTRRHGLDDPGHLAAALAALHDPAAAAGRYPVLTRWLADPAGSPADEQFELGLGFLLDGIASSLPLLTAEPIRCGRPRSGGPTEPGGGARPCPPRWLPRQTRPP